MGVSKSPGVQTRSATAKGLNQSGDLISVLAVGLHILPSRQQLGQVLDPPSITNRYLSPGDVLLDHPSLAPPWIQTSFSSNVQEVSPSGGPGTPAHHAGHSPYLRAQTLKQAKEEVYIATSKLLLHTVEPCTEQVVNKKSVC